MIFTFPTYITLHAETEEEARRLLKGMLDSEHIIGGFSFTISRPIGAPNPFRQLTDQLTDLQVRLPTD